MLCTKNYPFVPSLSYHMIQKTQLPLQNKRDIQSMDICQDLNLREYVENVSKMASWKLSIVNKVRWSLSPELSSKKVFLTIVTYILNSPIFEV